MNTFDLWRSDDGAVNLIDITCGYSGGDEVHVDMHSLSYFPGDSSQLLLGNDGGVYYTANANAADPLDVEWIQLNKTLPTIEFYSGDITANFATDDTPGISAGAQDNGSSLYVWDGDPGPAEWQLRWGGDGMFSQIEPINELRWYQESQNGNIGVTQTGPYGPFVSANGAWSGDRRSFIFPYQLYKYEDPVACPSTGCTHLIAGSYRVWETILGGVGGAGWQINSPDLTKNTLEDRSTINQLAYSFTDPSIAIVGTNDGNVQYGFNLGQGIPNSATWIDVTGGNSVLPNRPILDVVTAPDVPTVGYAAVGGFDQNTPSTPGHVFRVTLEGACDVFTWEDKSGNLPNIPVDSIMVNPNYPEQVFAGTDWGLYYTNNINAANPEWLRFDAGLPHVMIWDMTVDRASTTMGL
jgi:hypothetical protein